MKIMIDNIERIIEEIKQYAKSVEEQPRFEHSIRVAETAEYMCELYNVDKKKGYLAGIAHDICKNFNDDEMKSLVIQDGGLISEIENLKPSLLHGRAAAVVLKNKFLIADKDVLQAVAVHTFGEKGICDLAKIIYCADKIEPGREHSTEEYRKNLFAMSLDKLTLTIVEENIDYLKSKDKKIAPISIDFQNDLRSKVL